MKVIFFDQKHKLAATSQNGRTDKQQSAQEYKEQTTVLRPVCLCTCVSRLVFFQRRYLLSVLLSPYRLIILRTGYNTVLRVEYASVTSGVTNGGQLPPGAAGEGGRKTAV